MAKRKRAPQPAEALERANPFARQHGDYQSDFVTHVDTATKAQADVNRGGTPVARWTASGALNEAQQAVIAWCIELWRIAGTERRITANYGERIPGEGCVELANARQIRARDDLHRVKGYFPAPLDAYWHVFENVCRWDMPAGVAGSHLSRSSRSADVRAHQVVCFVADIIGSRERIT